MKKIGFVRYRPEAAELRKAIGRLVAAGVGERDIRVGEDIRECWAAVPAGDMVIVGTLSEVCSDIVSLLAVLDEMEERRIALRSLADPWLDMSHDSGKRARFLKGLNRFGWEGLNLSMGDAAGVPQVRKRGRPRGVSGERLRKSQTGMLLYQHSDLSVAAICEMIGLEQRSFYRYLNANKEVPRRRVGAD